MPTLCHILTHFKHIRGVGFGLCPPIIQRPPLHKSPNCPALNVLGNMGQVGWTRPCPPTTFFYKREQCLNVHFRGGQCPRALSWGGQCPSVPLNVQLSFSRGRQCPALGCPINCPQIVLLHIFEQRNTEERKITPTSQWWGFVNPQVTWILLLRKTNEK